MSLKDSFLKNWELQFPNFKPKNTHLLLAISGGVDSIVLLALIKQLGFSYSIAHCNFQLRGIESDRDQEFVSTLTQHSSLYIRRFETQKFASEKKIAIQEAARILRYDWFQELLNELTDSQQKKVLLVTAHHADDNIETLLMHFFRGTGIAGLKGIQAIQEKRSIIRPLLFCRKSELQKFAKDHALKYVEDSSNSSDKYTRNFFRNQLIPQIQQVFPDVENNLLENLNRFNEVNEIYQEAVEQKLQRLLIRKNNETHIPIRLLQNEKSISTLIWEIAKQFGFRASQNSEIQKLLSATNGAFVASTTHQIIRNRNWLIIAALNHERSQYYTINQNDFSIQFANGELSIVQIASPINAFENNPMKAVLDADQIKFPLLLRKISVGDYFYPLGMKKKKKISRFLIDLKLSKTEKENIWILESDKKIIWVIGYRIDDRFKIQNHTKNQLVFNFSPTNL